MEADGDINQVPLPDGLRFWQQELYRDMILMEVDCFGEQSNSLRTSSRVQVLPYLPMCTYVRMELVQDSRC